MGPDAPQVTPRGHVPSLSQPPLLVPSVQKPPCFVGATHNVLPSGSETFLVSPGMAPGSMPGGAPSPSDSKSWTTFGGAFSALQKSRSWDPNPHGWGYEEECDDDRGESKHGLERAQAPLLPRGGDRIGRHQERKSLT